MKVKEKVTSETGEGQRILSQMVENAEDELHYCNTQAKRAKITLEALKDYQVKIKKLHKKELR